VHPSDQRTSPHHPNPRDRNRRNRARCTGMTMKKMTTISGTTIRMTNRVTVAKRGRARVERAAQPSGSGRWMISSHHPLYHPLNRPPGVCERFVGPMRCRLFAWSRVNSHHLFHSNSPPPPRSLGPIMDPVSSFKISLAYIYPPYTCQPFLNFYLSLCWVSRTALLHIHFETNTHCYRSHPTCRSW